MSSYRVRPGADALRLAGVSFRYGDAVDVLRDIDLHLAPGWTGVVGPNGAGKTTLLRLLAGELSPTEGFIQRAPPQAIVATCQQEVVLDDGVRAFAADWSKTSQRWRRQLSLDEADIDGWSQRSPGERKRWQIAAAVAREPDVLLLDEPSNHLDASARALLVNALQRYRGIGVLVSHDRVLLDELCTATLRVADGRVARYPGPYREAARCWSAERETSRRRAAQRTSVVRRARRQLAAARDARARAEASIRARPKSLGDSDGRSVSRKGRAAKAEAAHAQRLGVMKTRLARAQAQRASVVLDQQHGQDVVFPYQAAPRPILATLDQPLLAGERVLGRQIRCTIRRNSRVHLLGDNGAGKTTLLQAIHAAAQIPPARLLLLPQELDRQARRRCLEEARSLNRDALGRTMQLMALLGVDPDRLLASELPSPGEARKLQVASGLGRQVWCMLLDEPTNHFDLPAIERLEKALAAYPGAIVLVSHDVAFAAALCDERWRMAGELTT